jgi:AraC-like DNA-binding protein
VAVLRLELVSVNHLFVRQSVELAVAVTHRMLKALLGNHWHPSAICFRHCNALDDSRHQRLFGTTVQFNCLMDGIVCRTSDLDRALPSADPEMARYVQQYLNSIREDSRTALLEQVHQMIWMLLPTGRCSVEQVAAYLGRDRRTLHRQLTREGETFSSLLDQVRKELASRYLANPHHPLSEIAAVLGFSELSAFSRWFSRLFDCTPSSWRTQPSPITPRKSSLGLFNSPYKAPASVRQKAMASEFPRPIGRCSKLANCGRQQSPKNRSS